LALIVLVITDTGTPPATIIERERAKAVPRDEPTLRGGLM